MNKKKNNLLKIYKELKEREIRVDSVLVGYSDKKQSNPFPAVLTLRDNIQKEWDW